MKNKQDEILREYYQYGEGLGRFIILILIVIVLMIFLFVRCDTYFDEERIYSRYDSLFKTGTKQITESLDSMKTAQDNFTRIIKDRRSDTVYIMIDSIRIEKYYFKDSTTEVKYIGGQVVFPVTTYVLIGYDIDSFKTDCIIGLRDQIDSIFNIRF